MSKRTDKEKDDKEIAERINWLLWKKELRGRREVCREVIKIQRKKDAEERDKAAG